MRWTLVVVILGFFGLVAYLVSLRNEIKREQMKLKMEIERMAKLGLVLLLALSPLMMTGCGMEQVDEGFRGVYTSWGKVEGDALPPGLHFYNPVSGNIFEMEVREQKMEGDTSVFTRDTQTVTIKYAVTYYPDPTKIAQIYSQFGKDWAEKILVPVVLGSVKDTVGQYIADDLVSKRQTAKLTTLKELTEALAKRSITVTNLEFMNLDFDDAYEHAVEAKVVAIQKAAEAKNKTVEVQEQARQTVMAAEADAKSMQIRSAALAQNKGLVEYEAVQKWDGALPQFQFGNSTPFINLENLTKRKQQAGQAAE